ncbi:iron complex transport system permease protein [Anoxybacillus voinovskiensis]|uniref:Iron complex transport system permease protein n=1 Tax=Anoxybacteroides voinovskiense TaxID=230470 RepID=A0A840DUN0_9BACL|nr:iron ABC transporter permease [Anoxybacillus voinovskiensis]MBB4075252.1 iron complex transport system permease protein [Anoxybacillus voinovskiensis]GGJ77467.1 iron ABC transporter permease [Anoxybacillus voinovskiensis]
MAERPLNKEEIILGEKEHPYRKRRIGAFVFLLISIVFVSLYSVITGSVKLNLQEVWEGITGTKDSMLHTIVWDLRLPRTIVGIIVGMCLAVSGTIMQGVMKNPLADPGIIGVSSGAALMAVIITILLPKYILLLPIAAFIGGFLTAMLIYALAWQGGASVERIILVGVAVNAVIGASMSAIMLLYSDRVQAVLPWMAGVIGSATMDQAKLLLTYGIPALILSLFAIKHIRILHLGDDVAKLLGHHVERSRFFLIVVSTLLAGIAVSVSGLIGFIGLVIPHILRMIVGNDDRFVLPLSALGGGMFLVLADTIARSWFDPIELPVGLLLSFLGGPFFLYILHKRGKMRAFS